MDTRFTVAALLLVSLQITHLSTHASVPTSATQAVPPMAEAPVAESSLAGFIRSVVKSHPRIKAAGAALSASQAFEAAATRPLYNPELAFDGENGEVNTFTVGISQTLDWSDKRSARSAVSGAERLAMAAQYQLARRDLSIEALSALATYQSSAEHKTLSLERVALMDKFSALSTQSFSAGDIARVELNLATLLAAEANMAHARAAAAYIGARQRLNSFVANTGTNSPLPALDSQLPALPTLGNPQSLLSVLPEVQIAQHQVDAASALVNLRKREQSLDPSLGLSGGEEDGYRLIGLNLSIPLPVRNNFSHEVSAARAQHQQAQHLADDALRQAHSRLISARERYQVARSAWQSWQQVGQLSLQEQGVLLRQLWQSGELSSTDFLVQISQTIDSQNSALELRQTLWQSWFEYLSASGQIEQWLGSQTTAPTQH